MLERNTEPCINTSKDPEAVPLERSAVVGIIIGARPYKLPLEIFV